MKLSREQQAVKDFIPKLPEGEVMYCDGEAGSGKSTTFSEGFNGIHSVLKCSPAGIAAANIGGRTLHKTFQLHGGMYLDRDPWNVREAKMAKEMGWKTAGTEEAKAMCKHRREILAAANYLYIDEFPTSRCDLIDEADIRLRHARKRPDLPFGGLRIVASGDLGQLQPVVSKEDAFRLEAAGYKAPFGPFQSRIMQKCRVHHFSLTHLYRQSDPAFGALLSRVRTATHTEMDLQYLNECVTESSPARSTVLSLLKAPAMKMNEIALRKMSGVPVKLEAIRTGTYSKKTYGKYAPGIYPDLIKLKRGCRIIIKKNGECRVDGCDFEYTNGQSATFYEVDPKGRLIVERTEDRQILFIKRDIVGDIDKQVVDAFDTEIDEEGNEIRVKCKKLVDKSRGQFKQYPVTLGYAQTGHSSQGLTLDAVHVVLPPEVPFCPNWLYVVMSRVRSPEGLTFNRKLRMEDIYCIPGLTNNGNQQHNLGI